MDIGKKIKRLRVANQLTLEELANRSELTKGFLSQVERNLTSPSVTTLEYIVEALGCTMHEFFTEEKYEQITFEEEDFFVNTQDGYIINYIIPNAQKNDMEPILIELESGQYSMEVNPHEGQEFGYILSGRVKFYYGSREFNLKKGNTFYINGNRAHKLKNIGKGAAKIIWVSNPPIF